MLRWLLIVAGAKTMYVCMYGSLKDESVNINRCFLKPVWRRKLTRVGESMFFLYI